MSSKDFLAEIEYLRNRLEETEGLLKAIQDGEIDALLTASEQGGRIFTPEGAEQSYRILVESMSEGAATLSGGGIVLFCNKRLSEMLGKPMEEIIGKPLLSHISPADAQPFKALLYRVLETNRQPGKNFRGELNLLTKDEVSLPVLLSCGSLDMAGKPTISIIVTDLSEQKRTEEIVASGKLASSILEQAGETIIVCDQQSRVIRASRLAYDMFGINPIFRRFTELGPLLESENGRLFSISETLKGQSRQGVEVILQREDLTLHCLLSARPLLKDKKILGCVIILTDISERKKHSEELAKFFQAVEQSPVSVILTDPHSKIEYVNPKFVQVTGYSREEVRGRSPKFLQSGNTNKEDYRKLWDTISAGHEWHGEFCNKRKDGTFFWERAAISPVTDSSGTIRHFLAIKEDITQVKYYQDQLQHLATHDNLTGLANRTLLKDRLKQATLCAQRSGQLVAVLLLDLDRFKIINDSLGHSAGDRLLQEVAERLRKSVRKMDTVARLGGDEFVILLSSLTDKKSISKIAEKVLHDVHAPFQIGGREITPSSSLGISIFPQDGENGETLIRNADIAMYRAKEHRNSYCLYSPEMNLVVDETMELESSLHRALEREQFLLHFQPKVNLETGAITGAEALLRWKHPTLGMISPDRFIPLAEEVGLILPIGEWVLRETCSQIMAWKAQGLTPAPVAVNLSARQFSDKNLIRTIQNILETNGLPPHLLDLEVTESILMHDPISASAKIKQLKMLGISVALDDFGTGYSSLNYLRRFPVSCLKIDRSFICDVPKDSSASALAISIIAIARSLDLDVVAEGVEKEEQLNFLRKNGCKTCQGYLFSAPVCEKRFSELLRQSPFKKKMTAFNAVFHEAPAT